MNYQKKLNIGKCPDMSQRWPNCCRDDQLLQGSERLADCTALIELLRLQRQKLRPMVVSWWEKTPCCGAMGTIDIHDNYGV